MIVSNVIGIVLAGGRSTRMGRDKALLPVDESGAIRLVDHMSALLQASGIARVIISGSVSGADCIADEMPELGPLGGLKSIFSRIARDPHGVMVIVPVDMPRLRPERVCELVQQFSQFSKTGDIDAVHFSDHALPLAVRNSETVLCAISALLDPGGQPSARSIRGLLARLKTFNLQLPKHCAQEFVNVNTPEQWAMVRATANMKCEGVYEAQ